MLITFFKVRNRFRMEEIRLYDSPFKELADQVHLEILNLGLNDTRLLSKQYLMTISLQESSFAELFSIACRWYSPYKTCYHREKYDKIYTYIFHIWNFRKYGIICIAIYRMIPDEESGIRNGNVRVSKYFCNPCSIYRAKTPGFILYNHVFIYHAKLYQMICINQGATVLDNFVIIDGPQNIFFSTTHAVPHAHFTQK